MPWCTEHSPRFLPCFRSIYMLTVPPINTVQVRGSAPISSGPCRVYTRLLSEPEKSRRWSAASGTEEFKMGWWSGLSQFWQGFICGGIAVPFAIVIIEIIIKFGLKRTWHCIHTDHFIRAWSQHGPLWGGVRLALLALSVLLAFTQAVKR